MSLRIKMTEIFREFLEITFRIFRINLHRIRHYKISNRRTLPIILIHTKRINGFRNQRHIVPNLRNPRRSRQLHIISMLRHR